MGDKNDRNLQLPVVSVRQTCRREGSSWVWSVTLDHFGVAVEGVGVAPEPGAARLAAWREALALWRAQDLEALEELLGQTTKAPEQGKAPPAVRAPGEPKREAEQAATQTPKAGNALDVVESLIGQLRSFGVEGRKVLAKAYERTGLTPETYRRASKEDLMSFYRVLKEGYDSLRTQANKQTK